MNITQIFDSVGRYYDSAVERVRSQDKLVSLTLDVVYIELPRAVLI